MKVHIVYDNPKFIDRYTVYFKGKGSLDHSQGLRSCLAMNDAPFHPQGFCQSSHGQVGKHNGKQIPFESLPADCQKAVTQYLS